ncbi:class I SAM-dependent methyltransferase [Ruegeria arenilitoris]|uniref:class I SAM-dependent methyltransferase n=1 Tax=Ruegeria arenilitoris TaxID=1173585 RepID=UPI00147B3EAF|nr:class I SAM-dependent methyltransferase [Ruegeria arenilitoris]
MQIANDDQAEFWGKSDMGSRWLTFEDQLDHLLAPVLALVLDEANLSDGMKVLDIGCGTGASSLAAANLIGPSGEVQGLDISEQFLERARSRAEQMPNVSFKVTDAQVADLSELNCDALISRFGVMFFSDPVAAFANMAQGLKPGARITFAAWGSLSENPWFKIPHVAAVKHLGQPPKVDHNAPGPLAFHDRERVANLMAQARLTDIQVRPVPLTLTGPDDLNEAAKLCTRVGPAARVIAHFEGTDDDVKIIQSSVANAFASYHSANGTRVPAVINLLQARRAE